VFYKLRWGGRTSPEMRKAFCDKCHQETNPKTFERVTLPSERGAANSPEEVELCRGCLRDLRDWLYEKNTKLLKGSDRAQR
jgi:RNase P subunit RPR2